MLLLLRWFSFIPPNVQTKTLLLDYCGEHLAIAALDQAHPAVLAVMPEVAVTAPAHVAIHRLAVDLLYSQDRLGSRAGKLVRLTVERQRSLLDKLSRP
jgi:hypothetical protein